MHSDDVVGIGDLAGEVMAAGTGVIRQMHQGIAERPFGILGLAAAPVALIHDRVARSVYGRVSRGLAASGRLAVGLSPRTGGSEGRRLADTGAGSSALAVLNGLYGNHLAERGNPLGLGMEIRQAGATVGVNEDALQSAFPGARARLAVFVHGLFETDESWRDLPLGGERRTRQTYGQRLEQDLGFSAIHLRYNTGLHVSANGRELARLMDQLMDRWPVPVEEVVLVGHSMGGLVARSACRYAELDGQDWAAAVRHVFCLGSPHLGADLEKGLNVLGWSLNRLPETRALASVVNARSFGIKDLRYGSCIEEDWCDCDPDEFLHDRCGEVPFLASANYYFIAAQLTAGRVGTLLGDLLVRVPSASGRGTGRGRRIPFELDNGRELTPLTHFDLLNHPAVYEQIRTWVQSGAAGVDR